MACCSCGNWKVKTACASFFGIVLLALSILLFVVLFAFQDTPPATPCAGLWGPVTYLHRGNLSYAQENTFGALVNGSAALSGANVELDVSILADDTVVLFHDETLECMTGITDKNIKDVANKEALPTILQEIDGHTYNSTNQIPEFRPVVEALCNFDSAGNNTLTNRSIGINFDTKALGAIEESVAALKNSNCNNNLQLSDTTIWSTPLPSVVKKARDELDQNGFHDIRIGVYMPTGVYSVLGLKFMLKTRLLQAVAPGSSILVLHKTTFDGEEDLIQEWVNDGWCTGIYGITPEEKDNYTADYYVVDEGPIFPDLPFSGYGEDGDPHEVVYDDNSLASYRWLIAAAVLFLMASLALFSYAAALCSRAREACTDSGDGVVEDHQIDNGDEEKVMRPAAVDATEELADETEKGQTSLLLKPN